MTNFLEQKHRGQGGLVAGLIGIMVVLIIAYVVVLPVVNTALYGSTTANLTGSALTLSQQLPLFIVLGIVILVLGALVMRGRE